MEQLAERMEELQVLAGAVDALVDGRGGATVVEGPAGIGKTSLLAAARRRAADRGVRVLNATGTEVEAGWDLGVARQLLEPVLVAEGERRWERGAARHAHRLLDPAGGPTPAPPDDAVHQLLHGAYWLVVELADERPVLVVIDDAQWVDPASARFVGFLGRRLEGLAVHLLLAARPGPVAPPVPPGATVLRPAPLGEEGIAEVVAAVLGAPTPDFVRACARVTGGNPLLVDQVVREVAARHLRPDRAGADEMASLLPRGLRPVVAGRLAGAGPAATEVARSVAVLEAADLDLLADHARLAAADAATAVAALVDADVLAEDDGWVRYSHPVLRSAVWAGMAFDARSAAHDRAADLLELRGAPAEVVAHHIVVGGRVAGRGDVLARAGDAAAAAGSLEQAARMYRRAAGAMDPGDGRAEVLMRLGRVQLRAGDPSAADTLRSATAAAAAPAVAVAAAAGLAEALRYNGRGAEAVDVLQGVAAGLPADRPDLAVDVEAALLGCRALSISARRRLLGWSPVVALADRRTTALVAAGQALDGALDGRRTDEVAGLAARALDAASDVRSTSPGQARSLAGLALLLVDRFEDARRCFDDLVARTAQRATPGLHAGALANRASYHLRVGDLDRAASEAWRAVEIGDEIGTGLALVPRAAAVLLSVAALRGQVPPERFLFDDVDPDSTAFRLLRHARAELALADGRPDAALPALLGYGRTNEELGWRGVATAWRSQAAAALADLGRPEEGRSLVDDEVALSAASGSRRSLGIALHGRARLEAGPARRADLAAAVDALDGSGAVLDHAAALADLGAETGDTALLGRAHAVASARGATRLAQRAALALQAAGVVVDGAPPAAGLTPSEQRVAESAAAGLTNRAIAQLLFVSEKTVETHLSHAYRKLGIRTRHQLRGALA